MGREVHSEWLWLCCILNIVIGVCINGSRKNIWNA
jgi:hypothetical protein